MAVSFLLLFCCYCCCFSLLQIISQNVGEVGKLETEINVDLKKSIRITDSQQSEGKEKGA